MDEEDRNRLVLCETSVLAFRFCVIVMIGRPRLRLSARLAVKS